MGSETRYAPMIVRLEVFGARKHLSYGSLCPGSVTKLGAKVREGKMERCDQNSRFNTRLKQVPDGIYKTCRRTSEGLIQ
jgi:hypothetical protein